MIKSKSYLILLILIILALLVVAFIPNYSFGAVASGNPAKNPGYYNPDYGSAARDVGEDKIAEKANVIIGIIATIGTIVSVVILVVLGIKYMVGSVEEKAEYKKTMIPYLIGAVMVFAIPNLVQIIYDITNSAL